MPNDLPAPTGDAPRWLTLKEASDFLGVHFSTLRIWADRGEVRVFRTPGGHRRFSLEDLRRFLDERGSHHAAADITGSEAVVVETALVRVRQELARSGTAAVGWREHFRNSTHEERRRRGRALFALALAYVLKSSQRERTLADGRQLGWEYGWEAARAGVSLAETGRAVQFFRGQLSDAVHTRTPGQGPDADDFELQHLIDRFLDEVLYAVLEGYEAAGKDAGAGAAPSIPGPQGTG
jgi:excisionase family DNA binding protein